MSDYSVISAKCRHFTWNLEIVVPLFWNVYGQYRYSTEFTEPDNRSKYGAHAGFDSPIRWHSTLRRVLYNVGCLDLLATMLF